MSATNLIKEQIAKQFSRAAGTYDEVAQLQREMADRLLDRISNDAEGALIDLGCGTGYALQQLAQSRGLKLVGLDLARGMIDHAKQSLPETQLMVGDLEQTGLASGSFDFVFSNAAIQWCETDAALTEMARLIKPAGTLLVSTFGPDTLAGWRAAWNSIGDTAARVHDFETVPSLQQSLANAGFEDIELATQLRQLHFDSVDSMFQSIKKLGATNAARQRSAGLLGKQRYGDLCRYFENELKRVGKLSLDFECIHISACMK